MIKYTEVQKLRKTAGYVDTLDNENLYWRLMTTQADREKLKPYIDEAYNKGQSEGYQDGFDEGRQLGYSRGSRAGVTSAHDHILTGMLLGAPIGAVAGTGISALLLRKDMSNAKKLAILLAGAGVGGVTGAGVGGTVLGLQA